MADENSKEQKKNEALLKKMNQKLNDYDQIFQSNGITDSPEQQKIQELKAKIEQVLEALKNGTSTAHPIQHSGEEQLDGASPKNQNIEESNEETQTGNNGCDPARVQEIRQAYQAMIAQARGLGQNVAADNLQHFIDGSGSDRNLSVTWLRSFDSITSAESRILYNTEESNLQRWVTGLADGSRTTESDYWDADITNYNPLQELSYASGASDMRGDVTMQLARNGNVVSITGQVAIAWSDRYDWNAGQSFDIPGFGNVSDDDGIYLKRCGGANDFMMRASWQFTYSGSYNVAENRWTQSQWQINGSDYTPNNRAIRTETR